jgi:hypothetical protein
MVQIYGWRLSEDVPEFPPSVHAQATVRVLPLTETVFCVTQCMPDGQYSQVNTPFDQELFVSSFGPLPVLTTEVTTYSPFVYSIVDIVPPPLESGSIHFPAKPGIGSWPLEGWTGWGAEVGLGVRELHEQAMITIPRMTPMITSQNFLRVSICLLLYRIIYWNK